MVRFFNLVHARFATDSSDWLLRSTFSLISSQAFPKGILSV